MESVCVWNCRETVLKNSVTVVYISLCLQLVEEYCLYFLNYLCSSQSFKGSVSWHHIQEQWIPQVVIQAKSNFKQAHSEFLNVQKGN